MTGQFVAVNHGLFSPLNALTMAKILQMILLGGVQRRQYARMMCGIRAHSRDHNRTPVYELRAMDESKQGTSILGHFGENLKFEPVRKGGRY